jgi:hypothetical protein
MHIFFMVKSLKTHAQFPSWRNTSRLSVAVYSMHSQLTSIARGSPSICNLRTHHAVVARNSPNMELVSLTVLTSLVKKVHFTSSVI